MESTIRNTAYQNNEESFLKDKAKEWGFIEDNAFIFVQRMLSSNDELTHSALQKRHKSRLTTNQIADSLSDTIYPKLKNIGFIAKGWRDVKRWLKEEIFPEWLKLQLWAELWKLSKISDLIEIKVESSELSEATSYTNSEISERNLLVIPKISSGTSIDYSVSIEEGQYLTLLKKDSESNISCISPYPIFPTRFKTGEHTAREQVLAVVSNHEQKLSWLAHAQENLVTLNAENLQELIDWKHEHLDCNLYQQEFDIVAKNTSPDFTNISTTSYSREPLLRSIVIGISGGSCSGKTWLTRQFEQICSKSVCLFDLDGYYKDLSYVSNLEYTHDNPDSIDLFDAAFHLAQLKAGIEVQIPKYNFESHVREGSRICKPASIIIVEGVFAFANSRLLEEFDFNVWVEADDVTRYQRRLNRDVKERGRDTLEVVQRYNQNVRPGYEKFIYPNRRSAHITIHNNTQDGTIPKGLYALLAYCEMYGDFFNKPI